MLLPILPICDTNVGGLLNALRLWPVANVRAMPATENDELDLVDPESYADIWFTPGTASFLEDAQDSEQGAFWRTALQVFAPKDAPDVAAALGLLEGKQFLAAYQDGNGLTKLVGTPDYPLRLRSDFGTGQRAGDRNGYTVVLAMDTPSRAIFYLTQELASGDRKVFSSGFNFGFLTTP